MKNYSLKSLLGCAIVATSLGLALPVSAQVSESIEWGSVGNLILNPDSTPAEIGGAVRLGLFPVGFDFGANQTFDSLDNPFVELDMTTYVVEGQFSDNVTLTAAGNENMQLYIWFFNTPDPADATAWGIVTSDAANWRVPDDDPPVAGASTIIDTSEPGVFIPMGSFGTSVPNPNSTNGVDWQMTVIPEPSTYVLVGLGLAGLAFARRRKVA